MYLDILLKPEHNLADRTFMNIHDLLLIESAGVIITHTKPEMSIFSDIILENLLDIAE